MAIISKPTGLGTESNLLYEILRELDRLLGIVNQVGFTSAIGTFDSQPKSVEGLSVVTTTLYAQSADATHPGMVNTSTQTFAGAKTFTSDIFAPSIILSSAGASTPASSGSMTTNLTGLGAITITPTGDCTFNASGGYAGQHCSFIITTSGVTSRTLTFGANFISSGTLATGVTSGKTFTITFVYSGSGWVETSRTIGM